MPDCPEVFTLLSDYLDGELSAEQTLDFEKHIGACGPCVAFVESLRKSREACRRLQCDDPVADPVPEELMERIREIYGSFKKSASDRTE